MYGSHPAYHSADLELLGYNPEKFITHKFLTMLQNLWKEPIVSYLTTDESAAIKQLTLIYLTDEALEKDENMPTAFPLIVFTKHRSRFQLA